MTFLLLAQMMAIIADFMLVYLPAPTVSLRPPVSLNAGRLAKFLHGCPDNAFQVSLMNCLLLHYDMRYINFSVEIMVF